MSNAKAERLAAIRAANAQRRAPSAPPSAVLPPPDAAANTMAGDLPASAVCEVAPAPPPATGKTVRLTASPRATPPPAATGQAAPLGLGSIGLIALAAAGGALLALALPSLLPGLGDSLLGPDPKVYWYLSRSTAFVAYALLWLSMALGLLMTNKLARLWPGGPLAFDLHEHASILGLAFGLFHALILLGDRYASYTLAQILVPYASGGALAGWVGLGQVALYLMGMVGLSFYVRPLIGPLGWRMLHFLSFIIFGLVLLHGLMSGSDTAAPWARAIYWSSGGSLLFLTIYRVLASAVAPAPRPARPR